MVNTFEITAASKTTAYNLSDSAVSVEISTERYDAPGKMSFKLVGDSAELIDVGSCVSFTANGTKLFQGYIFTIEADAAGEIKYTAYDQLRYLKAKASYVFENMTLGQMIARIAADFGLKVGTLTDTGYAFPCLIKENETLLDVIFSALTETIYRTGRIFTFYDDNGLLTLKEAKDMLTTNLVKLGNNVTDYSYKRDINSNTYNRIKLVKANSETGKGEVYMVEDTETIGKWGLLQYYDEVDENLNAAQIEELCNSYIKYYNKVWQTIKIKSMGMPDIRAGFILPVNISTVKDLSVSRLLLCEKVTHSFENGVHTTDITVKDFQQIGGASIV